MHFLLLLEVTSCMRRAGSHTVKVQNLFSWINWKGFEGSVNNRRSEINQVVGMLWGGRRTSLPGLGCDIPGTAWLNVLHTFCRYLRCKLELTGMASAPLPALTVWKWWAGSASVQQDCCRSTHVNILLHSGTSHMSQPVGIPMDSSNSPQGEHHMDHAMLLCLSNNWRNEDQPD